MERYTILMNWNSQYSYNDHATQGNLQMQCNSYQNTKDIFHRTRTNNFKICMKTQKTLKPKQS